MVINCLHSEERLLQTKKELETYQISCLAYMGDMGDMEQCRILFDQIRKQFGTLDVLVNNAGISYIGLLQDMSTESWDRIIRTNLTSVFNCCKLAVPGMVEKKRGRSSTFPPYGASPALPVKSHTRRRRAESMHLPRRWPRNWLPATSR